MSGVTVLPVQIASRDLVLLGLTGSRAFGLDTPDSDWDYKGIFLAPVRQVLGLASPSETVTINDPDITVHELAKFLRLALACNPTVIEQLWLDHYEILRPVGAELVEHRGRFLSERKVRDCYGGYARSQFTKLGKTGRFGSDLGPRREKHARHLFRLLEQGEQLLTTGTMSVRVADPDRIRALSLLDDAAMAAEAEAAFARFNALPSTLPETPDTEWANDLLVRARLTSLA